MCQTKNNLGCMESNLQSNRPVALLDFRNKALSTSLKIPLQQGNVSLGKGSFPCAHELENLTFSVSCCHHANPERSTIEFQVRKWDCGNGVSCAMLTSVLSFHEEGPTCGRCESRHETIARTNDDIDIVLRKCLIDTFFSAHPPNVTEGHVIFLCCHCCDI